MFFLKAKDGVKIAVYDYNPKGRETVMLVHGWPLSHKIYEYQIRMLTQRGYRVVSIDLRGFGQSDDPAANYSYDTMAADIHMVICSLGLKNVTLTGFSMGGAIVLRYMNLFKGYSVKKLILLSAAAPSWTQREGYPYGHTRAYANQLIYLAETDRPQLCENFSRQLFASPQSEALISWFKDIALSASGIGTVMTAISLRDEDGRGDLQAVRVPTFIIYGEKDQIVSKDLIEMQHQGIKGSQLFILENSGHGIMYDQLELFNDYFLKALEFTERRK